jgi:hypothetical protein
VARSIYSVQFLNGDYAAGASLEFTVPAGYVAVLRDVSALNRTNTAGNGFISVDNHGGPAFTMPAGGGGTWTGRVVCNPGDTMTVVLSQAAAVIASGYLLVE